MGHFSSSLKVSSKMSKRGCRLEYNLSNSSCHQNLHHALALAPAAQTRAVQSSTTSTKTAHTSTPPPILTTTSSSTITITTNIAVQKIPCKRKLQLSWLQFNKDWINSFTTPTHTTVLTVTKITFLTLTRVSENANMYTIKWGLRKMIFFIIDSDLPQTDNNESNCGVGWPSHSQQRMCSLAKYVPAAEAM